MSCFGLRTPHCFSAFLDGVVIDYTYEYFSHICAYLFGFYMVIPGSQFTGIQLQLRPVLGLYLLNCPSRLLKVVKDVITSFGILAQYHVYCTLWRLTGSPGYMTSPTGIRLWSCPVVDYVPLRSFYYNTDPLYL